MQTSQQRRQHWQDILHMTQQLKAMSDAENFEAMTRLESKRQNCIRDYFATPVAEDEAVLIAEGIREILQSDKCIVQAAREHKKQAGEEVSRLSSNRKAINAYNKHSPGYTDSGRM